MQIAYRITQTLILIGLCLTLISCANTTGYNSATTSKSFHRYFYSDLWSDMRHHFALNHATNQKAVQQQIAWYQKHPSYFKKRLKEAEPYLYYIYQETRKRNMPAEIALIPMIESEYDALAYSNVGAAGLWQMMPDTASGYGVKMNWWYDGRRDVTHSTKAALTYLAYLDRFFHHNWTLAIAAYDSGEGTVNRAMKHNKKLHKPTDFWDLKLPRETKRYIPKLLALSAIISDPGRYHMELPSIRNVAYFSKVNVNKQIELSTAAKLAGISVTEMQRLNPGFRRWATAPTGPQTLLLPINKVSTFKTALAKLGEKKRVTWKHHIVKSGDSLGKLANKYHTSVATLQRVNHLKGTMIHIRQNLLIPSSANAHLSEQALKQQARIAHDTKGNRHRIYYTVRNGDSLWKIAHKYHVKSSEIRAWNHLKKKGYLHPKQHLTLWVS